MTTTITVQRNLYAHGIAEPPSDSACEREQQEALNVVAATCPSCDSHNVTDTGLGACGDCGLTDNLSAFMGGGMTKRARFQPSKYADSGKATGAANKVRAFTISGNVD